MADEESNLRSRKSGDGLGELLSPAARRDAPTGDATVSGLDEEFTAILASAEEVQPVSGLDALALPNEHEEDLVDSAGVLRLDLPDEPATQTAGPRGSAPRAREMPAGQAGDQPVAVGPSGRPGASIPGLAATPESDLPGIGSRRRRRRDPFKDMAPVSSSLAGMAPRDMMSLSDLKRIKRARVRHEGQRVITDDVKKLKSLTIEPHLPPGEYINYYVEPVRIEYYIPKESRFAVETRFLYIPLIDPAPRPGVDDQVLALHIAQNRFVDIVDIMNEFPIHITDILESYNTTMGLYESLSRAIQQADEGEDEAYRKAFYLCEVLMDYEPTLAALNFLGDFLAWNMNWLIRAMNVLGMEFAASDRTISYFIKKRNIYWEENNLQYDERFEILAALFYEQAFPNRGLEEMEEDYFYDIFDKKFEM